MEHKLRKGVIIGLGMVGSSIAFSLMIKGLFDKLVLIDVNKEKVDGEVMDLSHGIPFVSPIEIISGTYDDINDAEIIIITAGVSQKKDETRIDLISRNIKILKSIIDEIKKRDFKGILLIVSNPVDVLTYAAYKLSNYPKNRVIGSGTVLDSARLKYLLSKHLEVDARSVHSFVIGEHGDSELPLFSTSNISGIKLNDFCEIRGHTKHDETSERIFNEVKNSAYEIIARKGATYYGIALATTRIVESILKDEHSILPVSTILEGEYDLNDLALSIPSIITKDGVSKVLEIPLNVNERKKLKESANEIRNVISSLSL